MVVHAPIVVVAQAACLADHEIGFLEAAPQALLRVLREHGDRDRAGRGCGAFEARQIIAQPGQLRFAFHELAAQPHDESLQPLDRLRLGPQVRAAAKLSPAMGQQQRQMLTQKFVNVIAGTHARTSEKFC